MPLLDPNSSHGTIAVELEVVLEFGRVSVVGLDAVEGAIDFGRDGAVDFEVGDFAFESAWGVEAFEHVCVREFELAVGLADAGVVVVDARGEVVDVCHLGAG